MTRVVSLPPLGEPLHKNTFRATLGIRNRFRRISAALETAHLAARTIERFSPELFGFTSVCHKACIPPVRTAENRDSLRSMFVRLYWHLSAQSGHHEV
jgi:hypothetical protein